MRKLFFILALITVTMTASAQYVGNKFTDNISMGVQGGVITPLDLDGTFPLNTTANIFVQKGITPNLAFRIDGGVVMGTNNLNWTETTVKTVNVGGDAVLNWSNIFGGYKGTPRIFEVSTVTGLGWSHYYLNGYDAENNNFLTAKTGIDLAFNIGKKKACQFVIEPQILWNLTGKGGSLPEFDKRLAQLGVTAGLVYKFKTSNGTHNFVKVRPYDYDEVKGLNDNINKLRAQLLEEQSKPKTIVKREIINNMTNPAYVLFAQGSYELTTEAKSLLDTIKSDKALVITGYASPEGTTEFNQNLSYKRAEAVSNYLKAKGVKVRDIVGAGVAGGASNRVVVITEY